MLSQIGITNCYHKLLSQIAITNSYHKLSFDCYHKLLSQMVITNCYHKLLSQIVITNCYHKLLSKLVITSHMSGSNQWCRSWCRNCWRSDRSSGTCWLGCVTLEAGWFGGPHFGVTLWAHPISFPLRCAVACGLRAATTKALVL